MTADSQVERVDLGPVRSEHAYDILAQFGPLGTVALFALAIVGIVWFLQEGLVNLQSEGLSSVVASPAECLCLPALALYGVFGLFTLLLGIGDRVVLCRDGFIFHSRFPRRCQAWRWEDVERVEHSVQEDKKTRHKVHTYRVHGRSGRRVVLECLSNIEQLGMAIEREVSQAKWSTARQEEPETVVRDGAGAAERGWQVREELLAVFDLERFTEEQARQIRVSPDNRHVAYVDMVGPRSRVNLDRQTGELLEAICADSLTFSPDSSRFAYLGGARDRLYVFADGGSMGPYKGFIQGSPIFSPDSGRIAYAVQVRGGWRVYLDEDEIITAERVGDALVFSPNSHSFAFKAQVGGKQCILLDGRLQPFYDQVDNPHFSPDSQHLAYAARDGDGWFMVVDGVKGPKFEDAAEPLFSPDSKRIAYYARAQDGFYLMVDDQASGPYHAFGQSPFGRFQFSPDSTRMAYVVREEERLPRAQGSYKEYVVVDGRAGSAYELCGNLVFSRNSARLGYLAYRAKKYFAVVDDKAYGPYDDLRDDSPVFSPDGESFAFAAQELGVSQVHVDGEALGPYRLAYTPVFGPGERRCAFGAYTYDGCHVVIDGAPGKRYDVLMCAGQSCVKFDGPNELHYIASSQEAPDHWLLVTERI